MSCLFYAKMSVTDSSFLTEGVAAFFLSFIIVNEELGPFGLLV